ncbi:MAG: dihydrolipoyl dehydrogenase [Candidatus Omnitrophica bacterium]|nr:dihydrolipoyl dehydrogenase [Candidatus Omnitrophota bacterium]
MEKYDIAVIGAGPGGYIAAIYAARAGKSVAVIEKDQLGGACLNRGCIPTKAILSSLEVLYAVKESASFGIDVPSCKINFEKIKSRKDEIVKKLRQGIAALFNARKIALFTGPGRLAGPGEIEVGGASIRAKDIIIATGSSPLEIPAFEFNHTTIISSDDLLELKDVPQSLLIIGGGAIGCEFAAMYNAMGSKVAIVEQLPEILPSMDAEIAKRLGLILKKRGVEILTGVKAERLIQKEGRLSAVLSSGRELAAEKALICVGRSPNSSGFGLENQGIRAQRGRICVDEYMRTNLPNTYAIGDVAGKFQLAHTASYEGITACRNILGEGIKADYRAVPNCIYTSPEAAGVGMTEEQAKTAGIKTKVCKFPFSALGKANVVSRTEGFVKLVGETPGGRILGVHILGHGAATLIAEAALAVKQGLSARQVADTIHAHPTFSEGLMEACHMFEDKAIHTI